MSRQPKCTADHWAQISFDFAMEVKSLRETAMWNETEKDAALITLKFLAERMARNFSIDNPAFDTTRFLAACDLS